MKSFLSLEFNRYITATDRLNSMLLTSAKRVKELEAKNEQLQQQLKESNSEIKDLYSGKLGACHTCEQVAELNIKLEQQLKEADSVMSELADLMEAIREGEYKPDTLTNQPFRNYLTKYKVKE